MQIKTYEYTIKSNIQNVPKIVKDILSELETHKILCCEEKTFNLKIILNEIVTNSVVHGNFCDENKTVKISFEQKKDELHFIITDQGKRFISCNCPNDLCKESSRGILICEDLCKSLNYSFKEGIGNSAIIKFLL